MSTIKHIVVLVCVWAVLLLLIVLLRCIAACDSRPTSTPPMLQPTWERPVVPVTATPADLDAWRAYHQRVLDVQHNVEHLMLRPVGASWRME